jgi:hypothetical protein
VLEILFHTEFFAAGIVEMNGTSDTIKANVYQDSGSSKTIIGASSDNDDLANFRSIQNYRIGIIMANLSTKIKLYANQEVDFTKDVKLQDNSDGKGVFIAEWNLDIPKPTMAQLDAFGSTSNNL